MATREVVPAVGPSLSKQCKAWIKDQEADLAEEMRSVRITLRERATPAQVRVLQSQLKQMDAVESVEYVSKAEALARAKKLFADTPGVIENLPGNPFPAQLEVALQSGAESKDIVEIVSGKPGVDGVQVEGEGLQAMLDKARHGKYGKHCQRQLKTVDSNVIDEANE